jgi:hypothetical protein
MRFAIERRKSRFRLDNHVICLAVRFFSVPIERFVRAFEIGDELAPKRIRIIGNSVVERPAADDALPLFFRIVRGPGIDTPEFQPDSYARFSQDFRDFSRVHPVKIQYAHDPASKPFLAGFPDEWHFSDAEFAEYSLDLRGIERNELAIRFIQVAKHFCSDTGIGYSDGNANPDFLPDRPPDFFGESAVIVGHVGHFGKEFVDGKGFYFSEAIPEGPHETPGHVRVKGMIRFFDDGIATEQANGLPGGHSGLDAPPFRFVACRYDDLHSYAHAFSLERWIAEDFAGSIKGIAVHVGKGPFGSPEYHG